MYSEQYHSTTVGRSREFPIDDLSFDNHRLNQSYYLDALPYSSYNTNAYPFRQQTPSNVYFPSHQHPFVSSTSQELPSYSNYDATYLNVAVAAAYQTNTFSDPFDLNFSRHLYGTSSEQQMQGELTERKVSTSINRKRKYPDETMKSQYECEPCRVCDDVSSGYHFGVFTCEACKGFFRRYSKKSTILEPCVIRCNINKNNRNNCAACRFDKCKCVGMALDKIRFGKPPKLFRSSLPISSVKLEPNDHDFQLMLKLLECYQSFEEYDHPNTANTHSSIIFQFCHRLAHIVMQENERVPETFFARLKRHESAIKFLITGENDQNLLSWSKEPQAWIFAHNERWRLIMILLILAFDDEQIGGTSIVDMNDSRYHSTNDTVIERILRLFELECDQEKEARLITDGSMANEKNLKYMKAQFVLRFVDMMANDMISNRISPSNGALQPYFITEENSYRNPNEVIYFLCEEELQQQTTENCRANL